MRSLGSAFEKKIKKIFWSLASSWIKSARSAPVDFRHPVSVLALRPDRLGDFILSLPALKAQHGSLGDFTFIHKPYRLADLVRTLGMAT